MTWELPVGVLAVVALVMVLTVHGARAAANFTTGNSWTMTPRARLFDSIPAIVAGDAGAGLDDGRTRWADAEVLWTWLAVTETGVLIAACIAGVWTMRRWGPGRLQGMATAPEAERLLGVGRLRRNAPIIRPDLCRRSSADRLSR